MAARDPSNLPQPSKHNHISHASSGGNVFASLLKEGHFFVGEKGHLIPCWHSFTMLGGIHVFWDQYAKPFQGLPMLKPC